MPAVPGHKTCIFGCEYLFLTLWALSDVRGQRYILEGTQNDEPLFALTPSSGCLMDTGLGIRKTLFWVQSIFRYLPAVYLICFHFLICLMCWRRKWADYFSMFAKKTPSGVMESWTWLHNNSMSPGCEPGFSWWGKSSKGCSSKLRGEMSKRRDRSMTVFFYLLVPFPWDMTEADLFMDSEIHHSIAAESKWQGKVSTEKTSCSFFP